MGCCFLSAIGPVENIPFITGDAWIAGKFCGVFTVLEGDRNIPVPTLFGISPIITGTGNGTSDKADGKIRLIRIFRYLKIFFNRLQVDRIFVPFGKSISKPVPSCGCISLRYVYGDVLLYRKNICFILQHDDGFQLGFITGFHILRFTHR